MTNRLNEPDDTRGLTQREILLEVRADLKAHVREHGKVHDTIDNHLNQRPTRNELWGYLGAAGVLSGIVFAVVTNLPG